MQTLLDGVRDCLPLAAGAEITMEANPAPWRPIASWSTSVRA
jgi:coproporphyrinogen III oxidase-like Fe-S oxidoreductase